MNLCILMSCFIIIFLIFYTIKVYNNIKYQKIKNLKINNLKKKLFTNININDNRIPKNNNYIFSYWHDFKLNDLMKICIQSWKKYLPDFNIIILNQYNYMNYIDEDINNICNTPQLFSDLLRFLLLYKYGGLWLDISVLLTDNISFDKNKINLIQKRGMRIF